VKQAIFCLHESRCVPGTNQYY